MDEDDVYKSTGEMPGPVSTGAMVCTLPGTLLPCAGNMVIVKVLVVVVMVMVVRVIMMATMVMVVMMVVTMVIVILAGMMIMMIVIIDQGGYLASGALSMSLNAQSCP